MSDETMDLILKIAKVMLVIFVLLGVWIWLFDDGLTKEEKRLLRLSAGQIRVMDDIEISDRDQEIIDSLQTCHFFGDWQYIKEDDTKIFVTFHRDGKYNYKGSKGYFKGSGRWRWLRGQFIWLTGKRKDNNPLLYPYMQGDLLQDFSLVEKDKGLTVFTRVSGKGC